ncbi:MAG: DUF1934 domain-containing protein [Clostridia bacterium]|nr:DUF1934 domain-containing protein [Clostridia bacterium]
MSAEREIRIHIESVTYEVEASLFEAGDGEFLLTSDEIEASLEPEKMEIKSLGKFKIDGGRAEVSYEESEATGMEGSVTAISFDMTQPGIVTMIRTGLVSTALVFEKGKRHHCVYNTPYMPFELCVKTFEVKNRIPDGGILELDYIIEIRGAKAERTKFMMKIMD